MKQRVVMVFAVTRNIQHTSSSATVSGERNVPVWVEQGSAPPKVVADCLGRVLGGRALNIS